MTSLGYSEFLNTDEGGDILKGNSKYNGRGGANSGGGTSYIDAKRKNNRTLKVRNNYSSDPSSSPVYENGDIYAASYPSSSSSNVSNTMNAKDGITQSKMSGIQYENGTNSIMKTANNKIKQLKDYIEKIHSKGGEDSEEEDDGGDAYSPDLPSYPGQGMGVNVNKSFIAHGNPATYNAGSGPVPSMTSSSGAQHLQSTVMLNPTSSYNSILVDGFTSSAAEVGTIPKPVQPHPSNRTPADTTSTYARQYYEQFVPKMDAMTSGLTQPGTNGALIEKLNYIIHMLEEKRDEKTENVMEELVLYCFLGVFVIFVVDSFARTRKYVR
jgi:hypothetical protein